MKIDWLKVLEEIANEVYLTVNPLLGTEMSKRTVGIGASGDPTKQIDAIAEEVVVQYLKKNNISCVLVGEECGTVKIGGEPEVYMIVDSIDGTTNATRGINFASTSMAASPKDSLNSIETAVVMRLDNGKVYTAEKGRGAKYDGKKISPSLPGGTSPAYMSNN